MKISGINLNNIEFISTDHLRYENGFQVTGPGSRAIRTIKIEPNIDGKEGFSVSIHNVSGIHPIWGNKIQMAPKPMKVVSASANQTVLRGWGADPMAYGDPEGLYQHYGISIFHPHNEIEKIILHLHDRNIDIVYLK